MTKNIINQTTKFSKKACPYKKKNNVKYSFNDLKREKQYFKTTTRVVDSIDQSKTSLKVTTIGLVQLSE